MIMIPVGPFAAGLELGAAEFGLSEGSGGKGQGLGAPGYERRYGTWRPLKGTGERRR